MRRGTRSQKIDTIFVLVIFCVFAISVLMVLTLGASIYQNVTEMTREGHDERLVLSYIWTKVKNDDDSGRIVLGDINGIPALCFDEEFGGVPYRTAIYHYNGWVYELFSEKDLGLAPENGVQILKIDNLRFEELDYGIIKISSGSSNLLVSPRSGATGPLPDALFGEGVIIG